MRCSLLFLLTFACACRTSPQPTTTPVASAPVVVAETQTPRPSEPVPVVTEAPPAEAAPVVLFFQRGACFGKCPMYSVQVRANGDLVFVGERFVSVLGTVSSKLSADAMAKLTTRIDSSPWNSWKSEYTRTQVTDMATLSLTYRGKTVRHNLGDTTAPKALTALENDIDSILGTAVWISGGLTQ